MLVCSEERSAVGRVVAVVFSGGILGSDGKSGGVWSWYFC